MLNSVLKSLDLDDSEARTFIALLRYGPQGASSLAKRLGVVRSSLYGFLARLVERGLVTEVTREGLKIFQAESPEKIGLLLKQKKEALEKEEETFRRLLPELKAYKGRDVLGPRIQVFEGAEGLRSVLREMLLYSDIETYAFWPIKHMVDILTPAFFRYLNKERIRNSIYTKAIWPRSAVVDVRKHPYLGSGEGFKREIRIAPPNMQFTMGYWIYDNKVAFISSRKESFGFVVESEELCNTLLMQFQLAWQVSTPMSTNKSDVESFLKELREYGM